MKKLLSLPPNLVGCFHDITGLSDTEWFCTNDPVGRKLGWRHHLAAPGVLRSPWQWP